MPGPKGVITVNGNFQKLDDYDRDFCKISEAFGTEQLSHEPQVERETITEPERKKRAVVATVHEVNSIWTVEPT